jgi:hypothetical protein
MALFSTYGEETNLPEPGRHVGALVKFIDEGNQSTRFGVSRQALLAYELLNQTTKDGKPVLAYQRIFNLSPRSKNLRETVRALSNAHDVSNVDMRDLMGRWCQVIVNHITSDDGVTYANVDVMPLGAKAPEKAPKTPLLYLSLVNGEFDENVLDELSDRQIEKIRGSSTYKKSDLRHAHRRRPRASSG